MFKVLAFFLYYLHFVYNSLIIGVYFPQVPVVKKSFYLFQTVLVFLSYTWIKTHGMRLIFLFCFSFIYPIIILTELAIITFEQFTWEKLNLLKYSASNSPQTFYFDLFRT